jgi:hypothetical protein
MPSDIAKCPIRVGTIEILRPPPSQARVSFAPSQLVWVRKNLLRAGIFSPEDLHLEQRHVSLIREPSEISGPQLLSELRAKMADRGRGRGGGPGGIQLEKNGQIGQGSGWQPPQQQFPSQNIQPPFQQQPGFGYGYPPT